LKLLSTNVWGQTADITIVVTGFDPATVAGLKFFGNEVTPMVTVPPFDSTIWVGTEVEVELDACSAVDPHAVQAMTSAARATTTDLFSPTADQ
jgi:hypothetical protein